MIHIESLHDANEDRHSVTFRLSEPLPPEVLTHMMMLARHFRFEANGDLLKITSSDNPPEAFGDLPSSMNGLIKRALEAEFKAQHSGWDERRKYRQQLAAQWGLTAEDEPKPTIRIES